ncbi:MAG: S8 family serine peptidase [Bacteroidetes bacterium]|nr:S8 family serine peptidase [Bacteroidota bacterium]
MKLWFTFLVLMTALAASAQKIGDGVYWVYFTDKSDNGFETNQPGEFLSERSISRRGWQGLGVGPSDEPVTGAYLDTLVKMGVEIKHISRWLNGVAMVNADAELFSQVLEKPFVDTIPWIPGSDPLWFPPVPPGERFMPPLESPPDFQYGFASDQVKQVHTHLLHQQGYTGAGVRIAVLDAGFRNVDSLPSFHPMISEGRLLGTRNFVNDSSVFRLVSTHGMYVLSIIGADWTGNMMGTAPDANYYLCSTENVHSETRIEEVAWVEAAEYMDSLGFDVINTSLGYSDFDGYQFDHTYKSMDGQTTLISRAASMLASKGIILCNSAGNEGNNTWYRITAPSDAFGILCVGAVDSRGNIASFSSRGPSFDGRVKPEVVAMGRATGIQHINGELARGSGTSFSSPVMAGSVASLWQAYPEMPAMEMIQFIRNSGDRFKNPDATFGYGIPSFIETYWKITSTRHLPVLSGMNIYPNPATSTVHIGIPGSGHNEYLLSFYDLNGRIVAKETVNLPGEVQLPGTLTPGLYILEIVTPAQVYRERLIIQ